MGSLKKRKKNYIIFNNRVRVLSKKEVLYVSTSIIRLMFINAKLINVFEDFPNLIDTATAKKKKGYQEIIIELKH